jgi:hypothetical protein
MKTNQNQKTSWKTKARNFLAGGLIGLTALVSGCGSNNKILDTKTVIKPYVETAVVSDYVARHGAAIKGQVRQDLLNVDLNDRLSTFVWQNYSQKEKSFNERDFGVSYSVPLTEKGELSARVGYQFWDYHSTPGLSGTFGEYDSVLKAGAKYKTFVDLDFDVTQLLPTNTTPESGTRYWLQASKNFEAYKNGDLSVSATPKANAALIDNYYDKDGLSQFTVGADLGISKGNFSINAGINFQDGKIEGIPDLKWWAFSLGYKF